MEPLSRRQKDVLAIIEEHLATQGYPPSIREIASQLGLTGTVSVVQHLKALEKKGFIKRSRSSSRGIAIVAEDVAWKQELLPGVDWDNSFIKFPVIENTHPDMDDPESNEITEQLSIDCFCKATGSKFFLKVRGDAMKDAGIMDGDLAMVHPHRNEPKDKEIGVVLLNDETIIRRFLHDRGFIKLQPSNPSFDPIFVRQSTPGFHIIGTVTGIFRPIKKQA